MATTTSPDHRDHTGIDEVAASFASRVQTALEPIVTETSIEIGPRLATLLEAMDPGPALAGLLAGLEAHLLTPAQQLAYLAASERLLAWTQSLQNRAIVAYTGAVPAADRYTVDGRSEVLIDVRRSHAALHLLWSEGMARQRVAMARTLHADLPSTAAALEHGAMSALRAAAIVEGAQRLTASIDGLLESPQSGVTLQDLRALRADLLTAFEQRTVDYACAHDLVRTRAQVARSIARIDPEGFAARRARALREQCSVTIRHLPDGLSELTAVLPSEQALRCAQAIEAEARRSPVQAVGERIGARRARALVRLLAGGGTVGPSGSPGARRAPSQRVGDDAAELPASLHLNVTIDLSTLLGLRSGVAEAEGIGPMPAEVVRRLVRAGGAALRWLSRDEARHLMNASPTYRVPEAMRALIVARDGTCSVPNCSRPARDCEVDHIQAYDAGGCTSPANLQALCKRHHQVKTHGAAAPPPAIAPGGSRRWPSSLAQHDLVGLQPLHARLAALQLACGELADLGLRDTSLEARIANLESEASEHFDTTVEALLVAALPRAAAEGAVATALHHHLQRHHRRTCSSSGMVAHGLEHCSALIPGAVEPPPF